MKYENSFVVLCFVYIVDFNVFITIYSSKLFAILYDYHCSSEATLKNMG